MTDQLTFDHLMTAVAGNAAAVRAVTRLMPAGGASDKVFPPTYAGAQYAYEDRWIEGARVNTVLLDSVQS
jgi:CRISPR-associated protein Csb1